MLATKKLGFVDEYLKMRPKAIINAREDALSVPDGDLAAGLSAAHQRSIDEAVRASGKTGKEADALREKITAEVKKSRLTGANERI